MGSEAVVDRFGFESGDLILEFGHGADCDEDLRTAVVSKVGSPLLASDAEVVVDGVLIWFREDDGDLVDELVDALTFLSEDGDIWLMTPKMGRDGYIEASDIQDAAPTAGLSQTVSFAAGVDWVATRLVARKSARK